MKKFLFAAVVAALFSSCSHDDVLGNSNDDTADIKMSVNDFYYVGDGRVSSLAKSKKRVMLNYNDISNELNFNWTQGDRVAVFGAGSEQQIGLQMRSIDEVRGLTAYFDSESYRLDEGKKYLAYYPAINSLYQEQVIPVDYTGQVQAANNSTDHLGAKDYIVTPWTETGGINNVSFTFQHIGAVLWLNIKMPDNVTSYKQVTLSADDAAFTAYAKLDLAKVEMKADGNRKYVDPSCITDRTMTDAITISFTDNVTADGDNILKVWMMMLPTDFTGRTMTVTVTSSDDRDIVYTVNPDRNFQSGRAYRINIDGGTGVDDSDSGMAGPVIETGGKKWRFTSGNLYYNTKTDTWHIFDKQTDYVNAGGLDIADGSGKSPELIGLFAWGATGLEDAQKPTTLREAEWQTTYGGTNFPSTAGQSKNSTIRSLWENEYIYDWGRAYMEKGRAADDSRAYMTPSKDVFEQLAKSNFVQGATIKGAGANGKDVTGLIVIPGVSTLTDAKELIRSVEGASCLSSMQSVIHNNSGNTLSYKNITIDNYDVLRQLNDALFFPAASKRNLSSGKVYNSDGLGWYWTANSGSSTNSYNLYFNGGSGGFFYNGNSSSSMGRFNQMAVRLLVEVKE